MASPINKKELRRLSALARIELGAQEEEKLLKDLGKILDHFGELQELDTASVEPMAGGTDLKNVFRGDGERKDTNSGEGADQFPDEESGYLKIPPVFE